MRHLNFIFDDFAQLEEILLCTRDILNRNTSIALELYENEIPYVLFSRNISSMIYKSMKYIENFLHTGCLTTDMNKVLAFFMEKSPYFIENFDHILFTTDVSFVIMPYLAEKLKGNSKNFHLEKNFKNFWVKIFFQNFLKIFFSL